MRLVRFSSLSLYISKFFFLDHTYYKKWCPLVKHTIKHIFVNTGYVQVDISIVSRFDTPTTVLFKINSNYTMEK